MSALVEWKELSAALDKCAPGWGWTPQLHFRAVRANGQTYPTLPKHSEIEVGHVRKMARHLRVYDCVKKLIQSLSQ